MDDNEVIASTRRWLERAVIGLNLCPFAKGVHQKGQIRWVVSGARAPEALATELAAELQRLATADPQAHDTTLLIHPQVLNDFGDYNDFLDVADAVVEALGLEGEVQVASFHPDYRFADAEPDDASHLTNRSPHPMLHLLREESIERAVDSFPDASSIYERNIETLRALGAAGFAELLRRGD